MKPLLIAILLLTLFSATGFSQDSLNVTRPDSIKRKTHPIIYLGGMFERSFGNIKGFGLGAELNYQYKKNLFTLRHHSVVDLDNEEALLTVILWPFVREAGAFSETAFLYGKRYSNGKRAVNISAGISYVKWEKKYENTEGRRVSEFQDYAGIPFEATIQWFHGVGFGGGGGFRLHGNASKHGYIAFGIVYSGGFLSKN